MRSDKLEFPVQKASDGAQLRDDKLLQECFGQSKILVGQDVGKERNANMEAKLARILNAMPGRAAHFARE